MTKRVQRFCLDSATMATFIGLVRELIINTTRNSVHLHDGVTAGGVEIMRADASNGNLATSLKAGLLSSTFFNLLTTFGSFPLSVLNGGTGVTTIAGLKTALSLGTAAFESLASNVIDDPANTGNLTVKVPVNSQAGANYTYLSSDRGKLVLRTNAGAMADTLPQATGNFAAGWYTDIQVPETSAGGLTITPAVSTIGGYASYFIAPGRSIRIVSDGANYAIEELCTLVGAIGYTKNLRGTSLSATTFQWTADEIVVGSALGGQLYRCFNFNQTLNIATVGANGLDAGIAAASTDYSIYAAYNPATGAQCVFACTNAVSNGSIYSGGNIPAGFKATAFISQVKLDASAHITITGQVNNQISFADVIAVNSPAGTNILLSLASIIPVKSKFAAGTMRATSGLPTTVAADSTGTVNIQRTTGNGSAGTPDAQWRLPMLTAQTLWYTSNGSASFITVNSYEV